MLSLQNLALINQEKVIFSELSVTLLPGVIIILRGDNGSGKTSLLKMIAGVQNPSKGSILYGKNYSPISSSALPYCTYIGHKKGFKAELTILENLIFVARLYKAAELVEAAIHYFDLKELLGKNYYQLSAGNQQKVALARLILCPSKLWLLDEVETNLDQANRDKLKNLISIQAKNGGIIINTSHNQNWLEASTVINMKDFSA